MQLTRRAVLGAGAATLAIGRRHARAQSATIRIGLLTDFSGPFRDINGPASVACLAHAVAEFTVANPDIKVDTISADHQNKPDVAVSILRSWFDESGVARAKGSGREVVDAMKRLPTDDDCFGPGSICADGRKLHPAYLWEVERPDESRGPGDVYKLAGTPQADQAFRPLSDGGCPFVHA